MFRLFINKTFKQDWIQFIFVVKAIAALYNSK